MGATGRSSGRGHSTVLYHQVNQEDLEEDQDCPEYEERDNQRVFRDPNIMELNIHNKKLFWASFLVVEAFGLLAALLFGVQWALGFSAFLFPKFSPEIRSFLLPFHQYFGSSIICLAVAAALLGHLKGYLVDHYSCL